MVAPRWACPVGASVNAGKIMITRHPHIAASGLFVRIEIAGQSTAIFQPDQMAHSSAMRSPTNRLTFIPSATPPSSRVARNLVQRRSPLVDWS